MILKYSKIAIIIIFTSFLLCCQRPNEEKSKNIELIVWEAFKYEEHELFVELTKQFCKNYLQKTGKKVIIKTKRVPYQGFETNIKLVALRKKTPDLACFDALKVLEFSYHNILVPINTLANFEKKSISEKGKEYAKGAFDTNVISIRGEENLYGLPIQTTCLALFWNRKLFRQQKEDLINAGLNPKEAPKTWEKFIQYAKILTIPEKKQYGFAMNNSLWFTIPFFASYNVQYLELDKNNFQKCILGDSRSTAALQLKVDLYRKHSVAWMSKSLSPDAGFQNEKYAMILMGQWNISKYRNNNLDFGISLIPKLSKKQAIDANVISKNATDKEYLKQVTSATNVGGQNIAMFKTCKHKEIAYEFMKFITSSPIQLKWCKKLKQTPTNKKAAEILRLDPNINEDIKIFMEQTQYSNAPPKLPRYGYLEQNIINPEMELALEGKKTAQEALKDAAKKINEKILKPFQMK